MNKNIELVEQICKTLGVEIGEQWLGSDGYLYVIHQNGKIEVQDIIGRFNGEGYHYWEDLMTGVLEVAEVKCEINEPVDAIPILNVLLSDD